MKDYVVSYGYEIEWGDIDRSIPIPEEYGSWEGPMLDNGCFAGAECDVINRDGTLSDPLCETTRLGGEINVAPSTTIDGLLTNISKIKELFEDPFPGCVNHGHVHVYCPDIDLEKLKTYAKLYEKELVDVAYDYERVYDLDVDQDTKEYLLYDGGRLNSFDGRKTLHHDTLKESTSSRAAINLANLNKGKTIEFRCFRSSVDLNQIKDSLILSREVINQSQLETPLSPVEIVNRYSLDLPKLDLSVVEPNFIAKRHTKERGELYKYRTDNPNIWKEL